MSKQQYPKKILVRLTEAEKQKIEKSAKQSQLSVSRFLVRSGVGDERGLDPAERELREQAIEAGAATSRQRRKSRKPPRALKRF